MSGFRRSFVVGMAWLSLTAALFDQPPPRPNILIFTDNHGDGDAGESRNLIGDHPDVVRGSDARRVPLAGLVAHTAAGHKRHAKKQEGG